MSPSPFGCGLGPWRYSLSRPQRVYFCYGPVTRSLPWGDLVDRLQSFSFHHLCYPNYGALTSTPAGLSPAEHASLRWTHNRTGGSPASGSRTRPHAFAHGSSCPSRHRRTSPKSVKVREWISPALAPPDLVLEARRPLSRPHDDGIPQGVPAWRRARPAFPSIWVCPIILNRAFCSSLKRA